MITHYTEAQQQAFVPSPYQEAIFEAVVRNDQDIVVQATAGSGKSTTLKKLLRYIPSNVTALFVAFNSEAANTLKDKLAEEAMQMADEGLQVPVYDARTIHSLGNRVLSDTGIRGKVTTNKYSTLVRQYLREHNVFDQGMQDGLKDLVDKVRLTLTPVEPGRNEEEILAGRRRLELLCDRFEIDLDFDDPDVNLVRACADILKAGIKMAQEGLGIDFTDQLWLPSVLGLTPKRYHFVLVDEAQDLNPAQRELVLKARRPGGRFVAVGDPSQAIYGFAGASLYSIDEIIEATGAVTMPLSICYRCPKSVVREAASIHNTIEESPTALEGKVEHIPVDRVSHLVRPGDLILCRLNAPLVDLCMDLLRDGQRATVRGRDLGASFTALLKKIRKFFPKVPDDQFFENLREYASEYQAKQITVLSSGNEDNGAKIESLIDKIDTLNILYGTYAPRNTGTLEGFEAYAKEFFQEDRDAQIILSSEHRAKGLEYPRVFILNWHKQPSKRAKTPAALKQEHNLMYVAVTRAMRELYLTGEDTLPEAKEEPFEEE